MHVPEGEDRGGHVGDQQDQEDAGAEGLEAVTNVAETSTHKLELKSNPGFTKTRRFPKDAVRKAEAAFDICRADEAPDEGDRTE